METNFIINNYISSLYTEFDKRNFSAFLDKFYNFNINLNTYKNLFTQNTEKVKNEFLKRFAENKAKISYFDSKLWFKMHVSFKDDIKKFVDPIILEIPVFDTDFYNVMLILGDYFIETQKSMEIELCKVVMNPLVRIKFYNIDQTKEFLEFYSNNIKIKEITSSRVVPILYQENFIGIYKEIKPYNFKTFFATNLFNFFNNISSGDEATIEGFFLYVDRKYKSETKINKKRMYEILYKYIDILLNGKSIYELFTNDNVMDFSSYSPEGYNIKSHENGMIYFENKIDNNVIEFGSDTFLNIAYAKYYDNVIKKTTSETYYIKYYSLYSEILASNYKSIGKLLELTNSDMDNTYKILSLCSSAFFAYKKMHFDIKEIYSILNKVISSFLNLREEKSINNNVYTLTKEYANKTVKLKSGLIITIGDFFYKHNLINNIPANANIHLKNGEVVSGTVFLDNIYKYIENYDNFNELMEDNVILIEYN